MAGGMVVDAPEKTNQRGFSVSLRASAVSGGCIGGPITTPGLTDVTANEGYGEWHVSYDVRAPNLSRVVEESQQHAKEV